MLNIAGNPIKDISVYLLFGGHVFRRQRQFGDERPFTREGNYQLLIALCKIKRKILRVAAASWTV